MATIRSLVWRTRGWILAVFMLTGFAAMAPAHAELEIISLRHRTVDQVVPILRPLLDPGGVLSGQNNQLIVRTSPGNLAEIRRVLASIDQPLRRLAISVRFDAHGVSNASGAVASGTIRSGDVAVTTRPRASDRTEVEIRVRETRSNFDDRIDQRIQVLEGGQAFISTGESRPVRQRQIVQTPTGTVVNETTAIQEVRTGFHVVPRVSGQSVTLEITPQRETFQDPQPGRGGASPTQAQRVATTVSARLGEWIELGGSGVDLQREASGALSSANARSLDNRRVWVRVDEVSP